MLAYLVYQCPEASPSLRGNWMMKSSSGAKGPTLMHIWLLSALFPPNEFLFLSHSQLSLLLHLAVAHLGRIIKSKVIRFFTLAQYTFFQTIIPVSFSRLNQFPPSPPGCGPQISWY